jgi:tetratricopeptide (TPR) repeat protein
LIGQKTNRLHGEGIRSPAESEIDSLKILLKNSADATRKVDLYDQLCFAYASTLGDVGLAHRYADSVKLLADQSKDKAMLAAWHYCYGVVSRYEGKYAEALDHFQQQADYCSASGDSSRLANTLFQVALVQDGLGRYEQSLATSYNALALYQRNNFPYGMGITFMHIGNLFARLKNYDHAIGMYHQSLRLFDSLGTNLKCKMGKLRVLMNLGNTWMELKQYEKARMFYEESLIISQSLGSKRTMGTALSSIGEILNALKKYDSALVYHQQALSIREQMSQRDKMLLSLLCVGETYMFLQNYSLATAHLLRALSLSKEFHSKPCLRDTYQKLSVLYSRQGNYQKAYDYHRLFVAMKDSVLNEETAKQIGELQTKYETGEKDKQIVLLAKEKEIRQKESQQQAIVNKALAGGFVLLLLIAVLAFYIYRQRLLITVKSNEAKEAHFKRQVTEMEMKALRAQINPHFLFNCMNSINVMIGKGDTENASLYLSKFSKLVRLILENAGASVVTLESEIALLESYIQLEELRSPGKITHSVSVDASIDTQCTYLPPMVLQPFVENAIWHGILHKECSSKGSISIAIAPQDDALCCTIEDNGVGRERAQLLRDASLLQNKSMGMKITEQRLQLLGKPTGHHSSHITVVDLKDAGNRPTGTRVTVTIPICHD